MSTGTPDIAKEFSDVLSLTKPDSFAADTPIHVYITTWTKELADVAHSISVGLDNEQIESVRPLVHSETLRVWDEIIVPYDLKNVPNWVETFAESRLRDSIPALVDTVFDTAKSNLGA